jgi:hypothetical protein
MRTVSIVGAALFLSANAAHADHFKFWLKAFIPGSGLDIVKPVPKAPGRFMIPGPQILGIGDSTCYNTNDRSFTSAIGAEAKITAIAEFDLTSVGIANFKTDAPDIGQTIRYDCSTGAILKTGKAADTNISISKPTLAGAAASFAVDADAANPLINAPETFVPSIKIHGTIKIDPTSRSVGFDGTIARFPSYEAYISVNGGEPKTIFQIAPAADATAWSLVWNNHINPTMPY